MQEADSASVPKLRVGFLPLELFEHDVLEQSGVCLAAGFLHGLADEESQQLFFARAELSNLAGVGGDDSIDGGF